MVDCGTVAKKSVWVFLTAAWGPKESKNTQLFNIIINNLVHIFWVIIFLYSYLYEFFCFPLLIWKSLPVCLIELTCFFLWLVLLYTIFEILLEVIKGINKWKDIQFLPSMDWKSSWIRRLSIVQMWILPKVVYIFSSMFIKISKTFFCKVYKIHLKICMESQEISNRQNNLAKEQFSGLTFPDYKTFKEATVIKTVLLP